jgi:hypothetical protein
MRAWSCSQWWQNWRIGTECFDFPRNLGRMCGTVFARVLLSAPASPPEFPSFRFMWAEWATWDARRHREDLHSEQVENSAPTGGAPSPDRLACPTCFRSSERVLPLQALVQDALGNGKRFAPLAGCTLNLGVIAIRLEKDALAVNVARPGSRGSQSRLVLCHS